MRRTILLAGVLACVAALGSDSPKEYDDRTVNVGIEGTWQLTEHEINGEKRNPPPFQQVMTYHNGTYSLQWNNGSTDRGSYHVDPTHNPCQLDRIPSSDPHQGITLKYSYQLDGDTLKIAFVAGWYAVRRPQRFSDKDVCVLTYKRVK